ncbi:MAG: ABC transporter substrate-binding protein [Chloroflexota bacterium]|nr:ABC transporter substrate-binding protein [Chloroflexia bacterium]MDQ3225215.1 ABC transporter substrate-binding protein [Chloroflexota bacterium]
MSTQSFRARLSRRQLLAATAGASLLTAGAAPSISRSVRAQDASGEPQPGGVYRLLGSGDIRSLDPAGAEGSEDWWSAGGLLYNRLYAYDPANEFYPDLAAELPGLSDDGLVYTIPLRQGVKFHNGREMVAADVAFSLAWQLWPEVYSWGKTYMENVVGYDEVIAGDTQELSGVKVIDPYTVEVTLKKPQAVFPSILSMTMNGISPKQETIDAGAEYGKSIVIGTGPFKFVEWNQGQSVIFERHPEYYREGLPYLDRVELSLNVEPSVQMLRWESGEAEWVSTIPTAEVSNVLSDERFANARRQTPKPVTMRLIMNTRAAPFDDLLVRQAVATAIDRAFFARSTGGTVEPVEGIYVPIMPQFEASFRSNYVYDPEAAKALLSEAGLSDGIRGIKLFGGVDYETQLQGLQADLDAIGIEVEVIAGTLKDWLDRIKSGEVQMALFGWSASFPDAYDFVSGWMTCASIETGYNAGGYCNEQVDELVAAAEALPQTDPERIAAYREIEELAVNTDVGMIGMGNEITVALGRENVHDDPPNALIGGWPFLEAAWIEQ